MISINNVISESIKGLKDYEDRLGQTNLKQLIEKIKSLKLDARISSATEKMNTGREKNQKIDAQVVLLFNFNEFINKNSKLIANLQFVKQSDLKSYAQSFSGNQKILIEYAINYVKASNVSQGLVKKIADIVDDKEIKETKHAVTPIGDKDYVITLKSYVHKNAASYGEFLKQNRDLIRDLRLLKKHYPKRYEARIEELKERKDFKFIEFTLNSSESWFAKSLVASYSESKEIPVEVIKSALANLDIDNEECEPEGPSMKRVYNEL